jgi:hypothetical protein
MAKPTIKELYKSPVLVWQDVEEGVGEPAIALDKYNDILVFKQADNEVNLNYETIPELCKTLKRIYEAKMCE